MKALYDLQLHVHMAYSKLMYSPMSIENKVFDNFSRIYYVILFLMVKLKGRPAAVKIMFLSAMWANQGEYDMNTLKRHYEQKG